MRVTPLREYFIQNSVTIRPGYAMDQVRWKACFLEEDKECRRTADEVRVSILDQILPIFVCMYHFTVR